MYMLTCIFAAIGEPSHISPHTCLLFEVKSMNSLEWASNEHLVRILKMQNSKDHKKPIRQQLIFIAIHLT